MPSYPQKNFSSCSNENLPRDRQEQIGQAIEEMRESPFKSGKFKGTLRKIALCKMVWLRGAKVAFRGALESLRPIIKFFMTPPT